MTALFAMVRKDLLLFFHDRRAVIMAFAVPIAIASFFGSLFKGTPGNGEPVRIPVAVVDHDRSAATAAFIAGMTGDRNLRITTPDETAARDAVRRGTVTVGVVIPEGFSEAAGHAMFGRGVRPELQFLYDPSHSAELGMVRGIVTEHAVQAVMQEMFTGKTGQRVIDDSLQKMDSWTMNDGDRTALRDLLGSVRKLQDRSDASGSAIGNRAFSMPYAVKEEAVTARPSVPYNSYAHSFAGMGIQFLLFAATNLGIEVLIERQRGLWKRLRSAPVSRRLLLAGKTLSATLISLMTLWVSFGFAMIVFGVRIHGSIVGFVAVSLACALMAATFGLLVAAVGRTPAAARGVTMFAVLLLVMLGGAWVPTFIFPAWLQRVTVLVPVRWAVDGLDAMTWRGIGLSGAVTPTLVLLGFAAAFATVAAGRFRWEEA